MIRTRRSKFYTLFFNWFIHRIIGRHFRRVMVVGEVTPRNRPVLLVPNHFSWWDGFIAWYLNEACYRRRFHIMMLEQQLAKHSFFSKIGAFSIQPGTRSILETLSYCKHILTGAENLLVYYPQGELASQHNHSVVFRAGIERILQAQSNACVVMVVALTDYFGFKKPTLVINQKEYLGGPSNLELQNAYNDFLLECVTAQNKHFTK